MYSQPWQSPLSKVLCVVSAGVWSQQVLPPRALPRAEAKPILLSVWCELSSSTRAPGSPATSLIPKLPKPMQGFCSPPGCRLRTRLTISVLQLMAVGAATITHSVSDKEEVRQKPLQQQVLSLCLFYSEASVEASVGESWWEDLTWRRED